MIPIIIPKEIRINKAKIDKKSLKRRSNSQIKELLFIIFILF